MTICWKPSSKSTARPSSRSAWMASYPAEVIAQAIEALEAFEFVTPQGATVQMTPLGVPG
jgi:aldehyde dehydrogenase (NAD+)